ELYLELVPRFGNLVLVKRDRVVAAAKEFTPAQNERRSVMAGQPYGLPPLATGSPSPPRLVAESGTDPDAFLAYAQSDEMLTVPLYVYRRGGVLLQAHVVPLSGFADAICTREPSLLAILEELYSQGADRGENERATRRRRLALKKLAEREAKLRAELASLAAKRRRADERDALRSEGEAIFAELHELPEVQRDDAKDRAAKLFTLYKKLGAALPHVERRERQLRAALGAVEMLQWEAQRVSPEELDDLEAALTQLEGRPGPAPRSAPSRRRKRAALEFRTPSGSRIVVGRSPIENAELTFKVARPNDWWFHARGIPGAHVILARDDRAEPPPGDVQAAAALAAYYSKAKAGANVAVDYALRKHVRKQRDGAPGLVWYTNAKTVTAEPRATLGDAVPEVPLAPAGKN
ncbi:MAG TPA: NFACT RNA binding domain-containing protein, partial [Candidatus Tumulicola sp.]